MVVQVLTPTISNGQLLIGSSSGFALSTISGGTAIDITNGANSMQVTNTGVTAFTVSGGQSQITRTIVQDQ